MKLSDRSKLVIAAMTASSMGLFGMANSAVAAVFDLSVSGSDAIFLAGRTDITIPPLGTVDPDFPLERHDTVGNNFQPETFPPSIAVSPGDTFQVTDASGGISFTDVLFPVSVGPEGVPLLTLNLDSVGGISGYQGRQGALTGVFLDDAVPANAPAPSSLNFTPFGLGRNFASLAPELGQVFFIGDGQTDGGLLQEFIAPVGSTRLFLGVPDSFLFADVPGAYEDNQGSYQITLNLSSSSAAIPEPSILLGLVTIAAGGIGGKRK